jgi:hypothetical protein
MIASVAIAQEAVLGEGSPPRPRTIWLWRRTRRTRRRRRWRRRSGRRSSPHGRRRGLDHRLVSHPRRRRPRRIAPQDHLGIRGRRHLSKVPRQPPSTRR